MTNQHLIWIQWIIIAILVISKIPRSQKWWKELMQNLKEATEERRRQQKLKDNLLYNKLQAFEDEIKNLPTPITVNVSKGRLYVDHGCYKLEAFSMSVAGRSYSISNVENWFKNDPCPTLSAYFKATWSEGKGVIQ